MRIYISVEEAEEIPEDLWDIIMRLQGELE